MTNSCWQYQGIASSLYFQLTKQVHSLIDVLVYLVKTYLMLCWSNDGVWLTNSAQPEYFQQNDTKYALSTS